MLSIFFNAKTENSNNEMMVDNPAQSGGDSTSDAESEISLADKIVLESNEKRLRKRMDSLQSSILSLKEQLKHEKELWKEDIEQIKCLQKQHQENNLAFFHHQQHSNKSREFYYLEGDPSRTNSVYSIHGSGEWGHHYLPISSRQNETDVYRNQQSMKQMMEYQTYKRKLAETETMCNTELLRVKQSLQDLKGLQNVASEWGNNKEESRLRAEKDAIRESSSDKIEEVFVSKNN